MIEYFTANAGKKSPVVLKAQMRRSHGYIRFDLPEGLALQIANELTDAAESAEQADHPIDAPVGVYANRSRDGVRLMLSMEGVSVDAHLTAGAAFALTGALVEAVETARAAS